MTLLPECSNRTSDIYRCKDTGFKPVSLIYLMSKSVSRVLSWIIIYLGHTFLHGSSHLPGTGGPPYVPLRCCSRWGLHRPASRHAAGELLPHLSTLTQSLMRDTSHTERYISVALSLKSPSPGVTRHPALRSPDFPQIRPFGTVPAIIRLTHII